MKDSQVIKKANAIIKSIEDTKNSFFSNLPNEANSQNKQNILRSTLVLTCSGIDALIKCLIHDTLDIVVEHDEGAQEQLKNYIKEKIKKDRDDAKFLSELFISKDPRKKSLQILKMELTHNSLQSAEEIFRIASFFNIETKELEVSISDLKEIFSARNVITHQFDFNMNTSDLTQNIHDSNQIDNYCSLVIQLGKAFVKCVESKIKQPKLENFRNIIEEDEDGSIVFYG